LNDDIPVTHDLTDDLADDPAVYDHDDLADDPAVYDHDALADDPPAGYGRLHAGLLEEPPAGLPGAVHRGHLAGQRVHGAIPCVRQSDLRRRPLVGWWRPECAPASGGRCS